MPGGRRPAPRWPRRGCACAAWPRSRRGRRRPRSPPPTSVCAIRTTSTATVATTPAAAPRAPARSAIGSRTVCHGTAVSTRPSSSASAVRSATPDPALAARVPTAPPYWTGSGRDDLGQPQPGAVQTGQPAGRLQPEGRRQRLLHQRAAHDEVVAVRGGQPGGRPGGCGRGRRRSRRRRSAPAASGRCRARPGWWRPRARRRRRAPPPHPAGPAPAAAPGSRRPRPSRPPSRGPAAPDRRRPRSPRRPPSSAPGPAGRRRGPARPRPSSSARNQASSDTAAAAPPRAKVPSKSPLTRRSRSRGRSYRSAVPKSGSYREEDRLAVALEVDVEPVAVVGGRGDQRLPRGVVGQRPQDGVLGVGVGLVGEVDPRDDPVEDAPREDRDVDVRRLQAAVAVRQPARA